MRGEHADQEHRAVLKGLPRFPRPRDVSQRDRQRNQSHRVEAKRQPGKKSDPRGHPSPVGKDLRQRLWLSDDRRDQSAALAYWAVVQRPAEFQAARNTMSDGGDDDG